MPVSEEGCQVQNLWRGGLPPLDCEAVLKPATSFCQAHRTHRICDCFAAERGQAPSPQVLAFT
ncbi:hypothetical protein F7R14_28045 [Pseudomonas lini]|uniref:Uncharacterized protein n=1 Tax=Pseudomonas lini TaxID=163011 RepID=A0A7V7NYU2_9PSED|nr:hypothetical protein F7R14_28045 [Pseudomonas lini]MDT9674926.1 hypothetical protein [Pseudomonas sp. JV414]